MRYQAALPSGRLQLNLQRSDWPLEALLDFATRRNPRRGFLFVSKVLGKHLPCSPQRIRASYAALAAQLPPLPEPVWVIGLAETATALGAGVAEALAQQQGRTVIYQQTTRDNLASALLVEFDEVHSHAPQQRLYQPRADLDWRAARSLVLVDDELTTGNTLHALMHKLLPHLPQLQQVVWASLVSWLTPERQVAFQAQVPLPLHFCPLLAGSFSFEPAPGFSVQLPAAAELPKPRAVPTPGLRLGWTVRTPLALPPVPTLPPGPVQVIGTGEFMYPALCWAEQLEAQGREVWFHSTTRSPILPGGPIGATLNFTDPSTGVSMYLHNPPPAGRTVLLALEYPMQHPLLTQPGWQAVTWEVP